MIRGLAASVWVLAISIGGCFNPTLQPGGFSCGETDRPASCPAGMDCRAGRCWPAEAAAACTHGGAVVGKQVYACRGAFAAGEAGKLCAKGYRPCESGAALTSLPCGAGFYAANATFCPSDGGQPAGCETPALLGCGEGKGVVPLAARPLGFPAALSCSEDVGWRCGPDGLATAAREEAQGPGGVLCCK